MSRRFTIAHINTWKEEGAVLVPSFFSANEMEPIAVDFDQMWSQHRPRCGTRVNVKSHGQIGLPAPEQFQHGIQMPFDRSLSLNLLPLHPELIKFAMAALETPDVRLYQGLCWAKFAGEADFDQPFHMDYVNHTLLVPSDSPRDRTVNFSIYASDITDGHGATRYVSRPKGDEICGNLRPMLPNPSQQEALHRLERSGGGPLGSVFAYSTDTYHRGSNLTIEGGHRYTLFVSYKAAHNDAVNFTAWPSTMGFQHMSPMAENPWQTIFVHASPSQLACLNVPLPGHAFWTRLTLARAQCRWPMWNLEPWRRAVET